MIKLWYVKRDPKENLINNNSRAMLNFGHTIGHAIETTYLDKNNKLLHGEAIAIGMICESFISYKYKKLDKGDLEIIRRYILKVYDLHKLDFFDTIIKNTYHDKKNISENIRSSLLEGIGSCDYDITIEPDLINKSLEYYNQNCDG